MNGPDPEPHPPPISDRAAIVISQAYYYIVAAIGLAFLLSGAIAALIALRKLILPLSESSGSSGPFGGDGRQRHRAIVPRRSRVRDPRRSRARVASP